MRLQFAAVGIGAIVYGISFHEVAGVSATFRSTAIWRIGERGTPGSGNPQERLVVLKYGVNHNQIEGRFSDRLADYLTYKNVPNIPVELPLFYIWGVAHAMGEVRIDGKDFPTNSGGYATWSTEFPLAPFPKYFFGLKDFQSAN